jgi:hypothetical protein
MKKNWMKNAFFSSKRLQSVIQRPFFGSYDIARLTLDSRQS